MKKVFLFLMSALVSGAMLTSCGDDDGDGAAALTGLTISPATTTKAVGETQQFTVSKVPANAADVTYTWTSSDTNVATVDNTGLATVKGIGTTTVTVTGGTFKAEATLTGTVKSLTLTDADGNTAGTYQFADEDISFTLTATVDPTGTAVEWSTSDAYVATVTANGLTAVVTIIDEGDATITVTAGGSTATYTISTRSILETAVGYWEFDDPNNLLKATIGEDLIRGGWDDAEAPISYVEGPAAGNGAASVPKYNFLKCIHGIAPNGVEGATRVNEYTIMFDVMEEDVSLYHAVIQSSVDDALNQVDEASFYLKSRGRIGTGVIGDSPDGTTESGKWYRVIFSAKAAVDGGFYNYYLNGELLKENPFSQINDGRTTLHPAGVIFFGDTRPGEPYNERGDGYDYNDGLYVAGIAIWDRALTAAEVAALGMFNVE